MRPSQRTIVVEEVPERCDGRRRRAFLDELGGRIASLVRPTVVLDCSRAGYADRPLADLLLFCLEEVLKRNGDVRLAGIRPEVWSALEAAGMGRLFRVFPSTAEAVSSFSSPASGPRAMFDRDWPSANAA